MSRETRDLFTSIFASYSDDRDAINLKEIRTRFGGIVKQSLSFEDTEVENMPKALQDGDFATFVADLEFRNVKFIETFGVNL